jgi:hypothetical protein
LKYTRNYIVSNVKGMLLPHSTYQGRTIHSETRNESHHKITGEEVQTSLEAKRTNVIDIMAALRASLEEVKENSKVTGDGKKEPKLKKKVKFPS